EEIGRTRAFVRLAAAFAVLVAIVLPFIGGDPFAKKVFYGGLSTVVVSCAWLGWIIRKDEGYTVGRALLAGFFCVFAAFSGVYFFGVFSPAAAVIPFGLCFFSSGESVRGTLAIWLTCAAIEAALGVLLVTGAIADR